MRLRVLAWNVHGFRSGTRDIAEAVDGVRADLVILNETRYLGFRLRRFARLAELEGVSGTGLFRPIPNAVLARKPWRVVRARKWVLPRTRRTLRRGLVLAVLGRAGVRLTVGAVHLGLSGEERVDHARVVTDLVAGEHRVIVGGDLNEGPTGPAASWIGARYFDAFVGAGEDDGFTFPSREPRARIDYLFVSEGITVEGAWTPRDPFAALSDHLPVLADLRME